jgi:hypothetical protein
MCYNKYGELIGFDAAKRIKAVVFFIFLLKLFLILIY